MRGIPYGLKASLYANEYKPGFIQIILYKSMH